MSGTNKLTRTMLLSVYSGPGGANNAGPPPSPGAVPPGEERMVLQVADADRLDQQVYSARAALIPTEQVLSEKFADFYTLTKQHLMRAGEYVATAGMAEPTTSLMAEATTYEQSLTQLQQELMRATTFQRDGSGAYTKTQERLAYNTYTTYLRAVVTLWRCIVSAAERAARDVDKLREEHVARSVLNTATAADQEKLAVAQEQVLTIYHDQVMLCSTRVDELRKKHMARVWAGQPPHAIPLQLHSRVFKTYLIELRAFLNAQPALQLAS
jgi:hypothetical protein